MTQRPPSTTGQLYELLDVSEAGLYASRAASMAVWVPWPLQPHSVSQNSPMKFPSQVQIPSLHWPRSEQS